VASVWGTDHPELSDHRPAEPGVPTLSTRLDNQRRRAEHRRNIKEKTVDQELFARFRKCAVEVLSVEESAIVPEANFGDDLDADSLDLVELVMALEEEFDIAVPEEDLEGVETVQQAYDIVVAKL
jgi:acyl carrier protein